MMIKLAIYAVGALLIIGAASAYVINKQNEAVQAERIKQIAKSNQNIAERRVRDATFDKFDAAELCRRSGLEWVQSDGKSFCQ